MKVISIGTDRKLFEESSAVRQRTVEYGKMFEKLDVIVFSSRITSKELRVTKLGDNITVYPTNSRSKFFYIWDAFWIAKKIIRTSHSVFHDSVISTQDPFETGLVGILLKIFYGTRLQIQIHTDFRNRYFVFHSPLNFIRFFIAYLILPFADGVRVVSKKVAQSIKNLNSNVSVLPIYTEFDGEKTDKFKNNEDKKINILTVARLEKEKDLKTAIRAFSIVSKKFPEIIFTIVGDGSQRKKLENLSKTLNLESKINFAGWQNNLDEYYRNADIYISTSLYEGYGMSTVEAALAGCALVISNTGIAGEVPALISKQKNVKDFAKNIEKLLNDEFLLKEMSEKAKKATEDLVISKEDYLERYKEAIQSALKK